MNQTLLWLERLLWVAGTVALGTFVWVTAAGAAHQAESERLLERRIAEQRVARIADAQNETLGALDALSEGLDEAGRAGRADRRNATASRGVPATGSVGSAASSFPARLEVPRLGLSVMVSQGVDQDVLRSSAGHVPGTALPGDHGPTANVAIAAHRDRHFRSLKDVEEDDEIVLTSPRGTVRYRVESLRIVPPEAVEVLDPTDFPALTLVTCYPFDFVGSAPERFIVQARRLDSPS